MVQLDPKLALLVCGGFFSKPLSPQSEYGCQRILKAT